MIYSNFTAKRIHGVLQVKEVALMHSEGILAGEMKHGPLALVDENMPIIVIATQDRMHAKMQSVIQQLRARNARLIVLCNEGDDSIANLCSPRCRLIQVSTRVCFIPLCWCTVAFMHSLCCNVMNRCVFLDYIALPMSWPCRCFAMTGTFFCKIRTWSDLWTAFAFEVCTVGCRCQKLMSAFRLL